MSIKVRKALHGVKANSDPAGMYAQITPSYGKKELFCIDNPAQKVILGT